MFGVGEEVRLGEREVDEQPDEEDEHRGVAAAAPTRRPRPARARARRAAASPSSCPSWWPPAKWAMTGFGRLGARQRRDDAAAEQDEDAVAEREQLRDLGRARRGSPMPSLGRREEQPVDLGSWRRRRRRGSARRASSPSGSSSATSRARPSAGCRPRASRRARAASAVWIRSSDHRAAARPRALGRRAAAVSRATPRGRRHHQVLEHAHLQHEPLALAVGGDEGDAVPHGLLRRAVRDGAPASDLDRAVRLGRRPKTASSSSLRPAPTSPARPTISPGATSRSTSRTAPGSVRPADLQHRAPGPTCSCRLVEGIVERRGRPSARSARPVELGQRAARRRCGRRAGR